LTLDPVAIQISRVFRAGNAEMRRQIAALKAEIEQAEINDEDEGQS
jgi:hypothetical protein